MEERNGHTHLFANDGILKVLSQLSNDNRLNMSARERFEKGESVKVRKREREETDL